MSEKYNRQDSTIQYYNENADAFVSRTVDIDMSNIYPKFTSLLPCDGKILDAGCGSGRDAQYFLSQGFEVVAIDASEEMVKCASNLMGQDAVQMKFDDVTFSNEFDGVWACASLLHVKKENFVSTLNILVNALKSNGVIYVSLKESKSSTPDGGRHFSYFSIDEVNEIMSLQSELELLEIWIEERIDFKWINVLARKNC
tara:strand:- start:4 stop:600 length:597 start_codon:yes stop_codon:yes gene_type:complete